MGVAGHRFECGRPRASQGQALALPATWFQKNLVKKPANHSNNFTVYNVYMNIYIYIYIHVYICKYFKSEEKKHNKLCKICVSRCQMNAV